MGKWERKKKKNNWNAPSFVSHTNSIIFAFSLDVCWFIVSVPCYLLGFVRAMQFFDTIIIAVATLLEPMVASLIAYAFDVGLMPGLLGYFGNALVCAGTIAVVISSSGKGDDAAAAH
jgi:hypothetical protein